MQRPSCTPAPSPPTPCAFELGLCLWMELGASRYRHLPHVSVCPLPVELLCVIMLKELFCLSHRVSPVFLSDCIFVFLGRKKSGREGRRNLPCHICKVGSAVTSLKTGAQQPALGGSGGLSSLTRGPERLRRGWCLYLRVCLPHSAEARSTAGTSRCLRHAPATVCAGTRPASSALSATSCWWI